MQVNEKVNADTVVLKLTGKMDFQARKTFQTAIVHAKGSHPKQIIVNFSNVSFVDSAGLGLLLLSHKQLSKEGIALSLERIYGYVGDVLRLANIEKIIPITATKVNLSLGFS